MYIKDFQFDLIMTMAPTTQAHEGHTVKPVGKHIEKHIEKLRPILACPVDKAPVTFDGETVSCTQCKAVYSIVSGVPVMLTASVEKKDD